MPGLTVKRRLVKSPPELWTELSEVERLAGHLGAFGEIKITKLEPERTVAWEGEHASGTVSIEPSGWGTQVTLTAELPGAVPAEETVAEEPEPEASEPEEPPLEQPADAPPRRSGLWSRLFRRRAEGQESAPEVDAREPAAEAQAREPAPEAQPGEPAPEGEAPGNPLDAESARAALDDVLDTLGAAHHRPFSRG